MLHQNQVVARVEKNLEQLEALRYTKKAKLAVVLTGHINEAIEILGMDASQWKDRLKKANILVMAEAPKPVGVESAEVDGLEAVGDLSVESADVPTAGAPGAGAPIPVPK